MSRAWEHFAHVADVGVRGRGASVAEAFEQAALGMTAIVCDPSVIVARDSVAMVCHGHDLELLLYDWLNLIIEEMDARHMLFSRYHVEFVDGELRGTARGEPVDRARHQPVVELKGATMTELRVRQDLQGVWIAQCVIDV